jgi:DNA-cytosine methyltransferase
MNILSLFDGMSCGQIALDRAGIEYENYFASEIDKFAIKVAKENYPETKHIGSVLDIRAENLPKIDLLIGGSPCQGFSFAGKQLNFEDPRSKLFFEYVRLLKECNPRFFLLENVVMKKEFQDVISDLLGVRPIKINSSLVSAQNRQRLYWTNIPNIEQPEDKGILLKDVIENGTADRAKSLCVTTRIAGETAKRYLEKNHHQMIIKEEFVDREIKCVYHTEGKVQTLTTMGGGHREPKILCGRITGRYLINGVRQDGKMLTAGKTTQYLEPRFDGKTNTLTTVEKDNCLIVDNPEKGVRYKPEDLTWRKLTPLECERLQTVPENYTAHVSNSQRYKMLGNGWTVDVIAHIFKSLKEKEYEK